jgi:acyl carrier protein
MELNTIPKRMQPDVISSFWTMLGELRSQADNNDDTILKVQVEGWYRQWNEMTGDNKTACWSICRSELLPDAAGDAYTGSIEPEAIANVIRTLVAEHMGLPPDALEAHSTLASLGADSLDEIELVMALEDEFLIVIEDEAAESIATTTIERAVEIVLQRVKTP